MRALVRAIAQSEGQDPGILLEALNEVPFERFVADPSSLEYQTLWKKLEESLDDVDAMNDVFSAWLESKLDSEDAAFLRRADAWARTLTPVAAMRFAERFAVDVLKDLGEDPAPLRRLVSWAERGTGALPDDTLRSDFALVETYCADVARRLKAGSMLENAESTDARWFSLPSVSEGADLFSRYVVGYLALFAVVTHVKVVDAERYNHKWERGQPMPPGERRGERAVVRPLEKDVPPSAGTAYHQWKDYTYPLNGIVEANRLGLKEHLLESLKMHEYNMTRAENETLFWTLGKVNDLAKFEQVGLDLTLDDAEPDWTIRLEKLIFWYKSEKLSREENKVYQIAQALHIRSVVLDGREGGIYDFLLQNTGNSESAMHLEAWKMLDSYMFEARSVDIFPELGFCPDEMNERCIVIRALAKLSRAKERLLAGRVEWVLKDVLDDVQPVYLLVTEQTLPDSKARDYLAMALGAFEKIYLSLMQFSVNLQKRFSEDLKGYHPRFHARYVEYLLSNKKSEQPILLADEVVNGLVGSGKLSSNLTVAFPLENGLSFTQLLLKYCKEVSVKEGDLYAATFFNRSLPGEKILSGSSIADWDEYLLLVARARVYASKKRPLLIATAAPLIEEQRSWLQSRLSRGAGYLLDILNGILDLSKFAANGLVLEIHDYLSKLDLKSRKFGTYQHLKETNDALEKVKALIQNPEFAADDSVKQALGDFVQRVDGVVKPLMENSVKFTSEVSSGRIPYFDQRNATLPINLLLQAANIHEFYCNATLDEFLSGSKRKIFDKGVILTDTYDLPEVAFSFSQGNQKDKWMRLLKPFGDTLLEIHLSTGKNKERTPKIFEAYLKDSLPRNVPLPDHRKAVVDYVNHVLKEENVTVQVDPGTISKVPSERTTVNLRNRVVNLTETLLALDTGKLTLLSAASNDVKDALGKNHTTFKNLRTEYDAIWLEFEEVKKDPTRVLTFNWNRPFLWKEVYEGLTNALFQVGKLTSLLDVNLWKNALKNLNLDTTYSIKVDEQVKKIQTAYQRLNTTAGIYAGREAFLQNTADPGDIKTVKNWVQNTYTNFTSSARDYQADRKLVLQTPEKKNVTLELEFFDAKVNSTVRLARQKVARYLVSMHYSECLKLGNDTQKLEQYKLSHNHTWKLGELLESQLTSAQYTDIANGVLQSYEKTMLPDFIRAPFFYVLHMMGVKFTGVNSLSGIPRGAMEETSVRFRDVEMPPKQMRDEQALIESLKRDVDLANDVAAVILKFNATVKDAGLFQFAVNEVAGQVQLKRSYLESVRKLKRLYDDRNWMVPANFLGPFADFEKATSSPPPPTDNLDTVAGVLAFVGRLSRSVLSAIFLDEAIVVTSVFDEMELPRVFNTTEDVHTFVWEYEKAAKAVERGRPKPAKGKEQSRPKQTADAALKAGEEWVDEIVRLLTSAAPSLSELYRHKKKVEELVPTGVASYDFGKDPGGREAERAKTPLVFVTRATLMDLRNRLNGAISTTLDRLLLEDFKKNVMGNTTESGSRVIPSDLANIKNNFNSYKPGPLLRGGVNTLLLETPEARSKVEAALAYFREMDATSTIDVVDNALVAVSVGRGLYSLENASFDPEQPGLWDFVKSLNRSNDEEDFWYFLGARGIINVTSWNSVEQYSPSQKDRHFYETSSWDQQPALLFFKWDKGSNNWGLFMRHWSIQAGSFPLVKQRTDTRLGVIEDDWNDVGQVIVEATKAYGSAQASAELADEFRKQKSLDPPESFGGFQLVAPTTLNVKALFHRKAVLERVLAPELLSNEKKEDAALLRRARRICKLQFGSSLCNLASGSPLALAVLEKSSPGGLPFPALHLWGQIQELTGGIDVGRLYDSALRLSVVLSHWDVDQLAFMELVVDLLRLLAWELYQRNTFESYRGEFLFYELSREQKETLLDFLAQSVDAFSDRLSAGLKSQPLPSIDSVTQGAVSSLPLATTSATSTTLSAMVALVRTVDERLEQRPDLVELLGNRTQRPWHDWESGSLLREILLATMLAVSSALGVKLSRRKKAAPPSQTIFECLARVGSDPAFATFLATMGSFTALKLIPVVLGQRVVESIALDGLRGLDRNVTSLIQNSNWQLVGAATAGVLSFRRWSSLRSMPGQMLSMEALREMNYVGYHRELAQSRLPPFVPTRDVCGLEDLSAAARKIISQGFRYLYAKVYPSQRLMDAIFQASLVPGTAFASYKNWDLVADNFVLLSVCRSTDLPKDVVSCVHAKLFGSTVSEKKRLLRQVECIRAILEMMHLMMVKHADNPLQNAEADVSWSLNREARGIIPLDTALAMKPFSTASTKDECLESAENLLNHFQEDSGRGGTTNRHVLSAFHLLRLVCSHEYVTSKLVHLEDTKDGLRCVVADLGKSANESKVFNSVFKDSVMDREQVKVAERLANWMLRGGETELLKMFDANEMKRNDVVLVVALHRVAIGLLMHFMTMTIEEDVKLSGITHTIPHEKSRIEGSFSAFGETKTFGLDYHWPKADLQDQRSRRALASMVAGLAATAAELITVLHEAKTMALCCDEVWEAIKEACAACSRIVFCIWKQNFPWNSKDSSSRLPDLSKFQRACLKYLTPKHTQAIAPFIRLYNMGRFYSEARVLVAELKGGGGSERDLLHAFGMDASEDESKEAVLTAAELTAIQESSKVLPTVLSSKDHSALEVDLAVCEKKLNRFESVGALKWRKLLFYCRWLGNTQQKMDHNFKLRDFYGGSLPSVPALDYAKAHELFERICVHPAIKGK